MRTGAEPDLAGLAQEEQDLQNDERSRAPAKPSCVEDILSMVDVLAAPVDLKRQRKEDMKRAEKAKASIKKAAKKWGGKSKSKAVKGKMAQHATKASFTRKRKSPGAKLTVSQLSLRLVLLMRLRCLDALLLLALPWAATQSSQGLMLRRSTTRSRAWHCRRMRCRSI